MYTFLIILFILLSFAMVVVILLQAGKGQGLAGAFGGGGGAGSNAVFGGRGAADFLQKATTWIAAAYMLLALGIGIIYKSEAEDAQRSLMEQRSQEAEAMPAPNIPVAPTDNQPVQ